MTGSPELEQRAAAAALVADLQARHVARLEAASVALGHATRFEPVSWTRDGGRHGGGTRWQARGAYDQASVNVSTIHYDDQPDKALSSATALSAIVHPGHPRAPSMHLHVSHTAMRSGRGYWRVMADLNPSIRSQIVWNIVNLEHLISIYTMWSLLNLRINS